MLERIHASPPPHAACRMAEGQGRAGIDGGYDVGRAGCPFTYLASRIREIELPVFTRYSGTAGICVLEGEMW